MTSGSACLQRAVESPYYHTIDRVRALTYHLNSLPAAARVTHCIRTQHPHRRGWLIGSVGDINAINLRPGKIAGIPKGR